jgi:hypothetical protein
MSGDFELVSQVKVKVHLKKVQLNHKNLEFKLNTGKGTSPKHNNLELKPDPQNYVHN